MSHHHYHHRDYAYGEKESRVSRVDDRRHRDSEHGRYSSSSSSSSSRRDRYYESTLTDAYARTSEYHRYPCPVCHLGSAESSNKMTLT